MMLMMVWPREERYFGSDRHLKEELSRVPSGPWFTTPHQTYVFSSRGKLPTLMIKNSDFRGNLKTENTKHNLFRSLDLRKLRLVEVFQLEEHNKHGLTREIKKLFRYLYIKYFPI